MSESLLYRANFQRANLT
ncbi:MAG: hypothetical protein ACOYN9_10240, partial [Saprospiraceae bacterium]